MASLLFEDFFHLLDIIKFHDQRDPVFLCSFSFSGGASADLLTQFSLFSFGLAFFTFVSFFSSFFLFHSCVPLLGQNLLVESYEVNLLLKALMHSIALWSPTGPWTVSLHKPIEDQWIFLLLYPFSFIVLIIFQ